jgi:hypothetical protein
MNTGEKATHINAVSTARAAGYLATYLGPHALTRSANPLKGGGGTQASTCHYSLMGSSVSLEKSN